MSPTKNDSDALYVGKCHAHHHLPSLTRHSDVGEDTVHSYMRVAAHYGETIAALPTALRSLNTIVSAITSRQTSSDGAQRPSFSAAESLCPAKREIRALLAAVESVDGVVLAQQELVKNVAGEGGIRVALAAINDLYRYLTDIADQAEKLDRSLDRVTYKATHALKVELEGLRFQEERGVWQAVHAKWKASTLKPWRDDRASAAVNGG